MSSTNKSITVSNVSNGRIAVTTKVVINGVTMYSSVVKNK